MKMFSSVIGRPASSSAFFATAPPFFGSASFSSSTVFVVGSEYGFVSSHAANAFAVALFLVLRYWKCAKRQWPLLLLIVWALATSYSRAYLGKHYPGDLVCGAILGCIIALIVRWLTDTIEKKLRKSETK